MGFPSFPFDEVSADSKRLLQQQLPPLVAFPCLLMGLLGLFFCTFRGFLPAGGSSSFRVLPFVSSGPWGARPGQNAAHHLRLLSREGWERCRRGCGEKDDIKTMQKMCLSSDSCGLRSISNPGSRGGAGHGLAGMQFALPVLPANTDFFTVKTRALPGKQSSFLLACILPFAHLIFPTLFGSTPAISVLRP